MMASNTTSIGVRGAFTAECMELIGIKNVKVIGCPSYYSKFLRNENEEITNESLKICSNWDLNSLTSTVDVDDYKEEQVIQTVPEYSRYRSNKEQKNIFFSIEEWSEWISKNNFKYDIGDRFHGNMICYLNDVKTIWVIKDRRIAELVDALKLPAVEKLNSSCKIDEIFQNYKECNTKYDEVILKNYVNFLNENGVSHKLDMEG